ncbi:uncharacterized protein I303_105909 [Kwoniella dejecticola CBS 10117]|uniref:Uncharacterized protein n=1 Tax=Kwoniella dejecticola CBS 10117 TaxID=1296121 RepID=A0A1A6A0T0_9TREE|nr:uncharacterized protein I303_05931 [Kwoniella dejecticola CBS 10117]OBR83651.1 hypothetical protein I303_05931 [Kwoniella dejecticola CBS 10117]
MASSQRDNDVLSGTYDPPTIYVSGTIDAASRDVCTQRYPHYGHWTNKPSLRAGLNGALSSVYDVCQQLGSRVSRGMPDTRTSQDVLDQAYYIGMINHFAENPLTVYDYTVNVKPLTRDRWAELDLITQDMQTSANQSIGNLKPVVLLLTARARARAHRSSGSSGASNWFQAMTNSASQTTHQPSDFVVGTAYCQNISGPWEEVYRDHDLRTLRMADEKFQEVYGGQEYTATRDDTKALFENNKLDVDVIQMSKGLADDLSFVIPAKDLRAGSASTDYRQTPVIPAKDLRAGSASTDYGQTPDGVDFSLTMHKLPTINSMIQRRLVGTIGNCPRAGSVFSVHNLILMFAR